MGLPGNLNDNSDKNQYKFQGGQLIDDLKALHNVSLEGCFIPPAVVEEQVISAESQISLFHGNSSCHP